MEAKDRNCIQREILRKYPGTIPEIDIDWDIVEISFKAGHRQAQDGIWDKAMGAKKSGYDEGRLMGIREVVEWIRKGCACFQPDEKGEYVIPGWQAKLKEWRIE